MKKTLRTPGLAAWTLLGISVLSGCRKESAPGQESVLSQKERELAEREAAVARREAEQKLEEERRSLERDRAALEVERLEVEQAAQAAKTDAAGASEALSQKLKEAEAKGAKLAEREEALFQKEVRVANREQKLSEDLLEKAGQQPVLTPYSSTPPPVTVAGPTGDYGIFYEDLHRYGTWLDTREYGVVWQPRAAVTRREWRPYTEGRWVCSDRGWTWISDEPFGWACYHYGRWALLKGRGWIWIPGDEWAPAWVVWHETPQHLGWAPMPPETLAYRGSHWGNVDVHEIQISVNVFNFVETRHFGRPVRSHCLPLDRNPSLYRSGTPVTRITVDQDRVCVGGPRYRSVRDATGGVLPFVTVRPDHSNPAARGSTVSIRGGEVRMYAPSVQAPWNAALKPRHLETTWRDAHLESESLRPNSSLAEGYQRDRQNQLQEARDSISRMGGPEQFHETRSGLLRENRRRWDEQARISNAIGRAPSGAVAPQAPGAGSSGATGTDPRPNPPVSRDLPTNGAPAVSGSLPPGESVGLGRDGRRGDPSSKLPGTTPSAGDGRRSDEKGVVAGGTQSVVPGVNPGVKVSDSVVPAPNPVPNPVPVVEAPKKEGNGVAGVGGAGKPVDAQKPQEPLVNGGSLVVSGSLRQNETPGVGRDARKGGGVFKGKGNVPEAGEGALSKEKGSLVGGTQSVVPGVNPGVKVPDSVVPAPNSVPNPAPVVEAPKRDGSGVAVVGDAGKTVDAQKPRDAADRAVPPVGLPVPPPSGTLPVAPKVTGPAENVAPVGLSPKAVDSGVKGGTSEGLGRPGGEIAAPKGTREQLERVDAAKVVEQAKPRDVVDRVVPPVGLPVPPPSGTLPVAPKVTGPAENVAPVGLPPKVVDSGVKGGTSESLRRPAGEIAAPKGTREQLERVDTGKVTEQQKQREAAEAAARVAEQQKQAREMAERAAAEQQAQQKQREAAEAAARVAEQQKQAREMAERAAAEQQAQQKQREAAEAAARVAGQQKQAREMAERAAAEQQAQQKQREAAEAAARVADQQKQAREMAERAAAEQQQRAAQEAAARVAEQQRQVREMAEKAAAQQQAQQKQREAAEAAARVAEQQRQAREMAERAAAQQQQRAAQEAAARVAEQQRQAREMAERAAAQQQAQQQQRAAQEAAARAAEQQRQAREMAERAAAQQQAQQQQRAAQEAAARAAEQQRQQREEAAKKAAEKK
ncbi:MAG: hypothetical protein RLZZ399_439 [Verrucomicrobiota bacterium]|jgi:hypothetical protein